MADAGAGLSVIVIATSTCLTPGRDRDDRSAIMISGNAMTMSSTRLQHRSTWPPNGACDAAHQP